MIMGVLGVWYNNFFGAQSHALLPYDQVIVKISKSFCMNVYMHDMYLIGVNYYAGLTSGHES